MKDWSDEAHRQGYALEVQTRYGAVDTAAEYRFHVISWRNAGGRAYAIPATLTDPEIALFVRNSETVRSMVITGRYAQLDTANYAPGLGLDARAIRLWEQHRAAIRCTVSREENEVEIRLPPVFDALEEPYRRTVHAQEGAKERWGK